MPKPLKIEGNLPTNWKRFKRNWDNYVIVARLNRFEETRVHPMQSPRRRFQNLLFFYAKKLEVLRQPVTKSETKIKACQLSNIAILDNMAILDNWIRHTYLDDNRKKRIIYAGVSIWTGN
jgi:hypothetical protein